LYVLKLIINICLVNGLIALNDQG